MRKRPLLLSACVFLTGLAYGRYREAGILFVPTVLFLQELFMGIRHQNWKRTIGRCILLIGVFFLGLAHMKQEQDFRNAYLSKLSDGDKVTIWGEIKSFETAEYGNRCVLTDCYIRIREEVKIPCNEVMVYTSSDHFQVGEIHEITGQFQNFSTARNPGNFDSRKYYQSRKIDFTVEEESGRLLGDNRNRVERWILSFKEKLKNVYTVSMEERAAGFYNAMLLGDKANLEDSTKALFTIGGISHILAISGLHMSMVGRKLYRILRKVHIGFPGAGLAAGIVLLSYCYMTGSGMSAVRAVGMMLLFFLAQCMGRSYDMLNALGAMCMLLLWENPFLLEYSGFWFSVLALVGVGFVGKILSEQVKIGKGIWMSVGITLATLPISACNYYEIPLYAPLVNMIVLPILTPAFLLAMAGGLLGLGLPGVAHVILVPCELVFRFYEWLCEAVSHLPGAAFVSGAPSGVVIVVYYLILAVGVLCLSYWRGKCLMIMVCLICFVLILYPKSAPFEITFLDVGQGDGIYISMGDGTACFIDGGSSSVNGVGQNRILPFLKSKGISSVDYWFVTHADTDHISGVMEVLAAGYPVKYLVVSHASPEDENYQALLDAAAANQTKVLHMKAGDSICSENLSLRCLYPGNETILDKNEASLVLELELQDENTEKIILRGLFTGDISSDVESILLKQGVLEDVDVYKVAHHGSKYSSGEAFLQAIQPEISVVSCSNHNLYGHPHKETLERLDAVGSIIMTTVDYGAVTVRVEGEEIEIDGYVR